MRWRRGGGRWAAVGAAVAAGCAGSGTGSGPAPVAGRSPEPPPEFIQYFAPAFSKDGFLAAFPELNGRVYTAAEYWTQAHREPTQFDPLGILRPGDRIRVWVEGDAAFDVTLVVPEGGVVDLPVAGPVQVAGKTPSALASELQPRVARSYRVPPRVAKLPPERPAAAGAPRPLPLAGGPPVACAGEVRNPAAPLPVGLLTLKRGLDGWGPTTQANLRVVWVFRELPELDRKRVGLVCDIVELNRGDFKQDLPLFPGDLVVVSALQSRDPARDSLRIRARTDWLLGRIAREDFLRALMP